MICMQHWKPSVPFFFLESHADYRTWVVSIFDTMVLMIVPPQPVPWEVSTAELFFINLNPSLSMTSMLQLNFLTHCYNKEQLWNGLCAPCIVIPPKKDKWIRKIIFIYKTHNVYIFILAFIHLSLHQYGCYLI